MKRNKSKPNPSDLFVVYLPPDSLNLSWGAKGLWVFIQSLGDRPITVDELQQPLNTSDEIDGWIAELIVAGLIHIEGQS